MFLDISFLVEKFSVYPLNIFGKVLFFIFRKDSLLQTADVTCRVWPWLHMSLRPHLQLDNCRQILYPGEPLVTSVENEDSSVCQGSCGKLNKMCYLFLHDDFLRHPLVQKVLNKSSFPPAYLLLEYGAVAFEGSLAFSYPSSFSPVPTGGRVPRRNRQQG